MATFDLYFDNSICGNIIVERSGLFVNIAVTLSVVSDKILRAYITDGESVFLTGVLCPCGSNSKINKSFSVHEFDRILKKSNKTLFGFAAQKDNADAVFCKLEKHIDSLNKSKIPQYIPPYMRANQPASLKFNNRSECPFIWSICENPGKYIDFLQEPAKIKYCLLMRHNEHSTVIAAPLSSTTEFVFAPAFSICTPIIVGGSYYAALQILSDKSLTYLNNNPCIGKNNYENILRSEQNARIDHKGAPGS